MSEPLPVSTISPFTSPSLRRIAVTLAVLAVYRIGSWIPLPGVDAAALFEIGAAHSAVARVSIMALGVNAWLSMLILAEIAMIAAPPLRRWATSPRNAASFQGWIVLGALALSGFQANGIAVALEDIGSIVTSPGLGFRFGVIATLVAATGFLIWMASLVSRFGLGSGFLLLLAAPLCIDFPGMLVAQAAAWGPASELSIPLTIALFLAAAAALVLATGGRPMSPAAAGQILWPPLIAYAAASWLPLLVVLALAPEHLNAALDALKPGEPARIVLITALTLAIALWRARALAEDGDPARDGASPWILALALAAVVGVFESLLAILPVPLALDGRSVVIMVAFALSLLSTMGPANVPEPEHPS